jgi:hypothetical protein
MRADDDLTISPERLSEVRDTVRRRIALRKGHRLSRTATAIGACVVVAAASAAYSALQASPPASRAKSGANSASQPSHSVTVVTTSTTRSTAGGTVTTSVPSRSVPHYVYRPPAGTIEIPPPHVVGSTPSSAEANGSLRNVSVYWMADRSSDAPAGTILSEVIGWNPVSPQSVVGQIESSEHPAIIHSRLGDRLDGGRWCPARRSTECRGCDGRVRRSPAHTTWHDLKAN